MIPMASRDVGALALNKMYAAAHRSMQSRSGQRDGRLQAAVPRETHRVYMYMLPRKKSVEASRGAQATNIPLRILSVEWIHEGSGSLDRSS